MLDTAVIFRLNRLHSFTIALGYVMSPRQSRSQSSQDDIRFREDALSYPSDSLTLRQLRTFCPQVDGLGPLVGAVRAMESNLAQVAFVQATFSAQGLEEAISPLSQEETEQHLRDLKRLYIQLELLANGERTAELLIRNIEQQARNLVPRRPR